MLKGVKSEEKAQKEKETNFIVKGPVVERCETPKQVLEEILKDLGIEAQPEKGEVIKNKKIQNNNVFSLRMFMMVFVKFLVGRCLPSRKIFTRRQCLTP